MASKTASDDNTAAPADDGDKKPAAVSSNSLSQYLDCMRKADEARWNGNMEVAETEYRRALELRPSMFQPNLSLAQVLRIRRKYVEAFDRFVKVYEMQPDNPSIMTHLAEMAYFAGHNDTAKAVLCNAIMANDHFVPAICYLADILMAEGDYDKALELLQPAIEDQPHSSELWSTLGTLMHMQDDEENARTFYQEALRLDPQSYQARRNLETLDQQEGDTAGDSGASSKERPTIN